MASWKFIFFGLISASLFLNLASSTSAHKAKGILDARLARIAADRNDTLDVHEIIANLTRLIVRVNEENAKKFEKKFKKMEEKLNGMESILFQLKNASGGATSLCACADNATTMPVKVKVEPTDFRNASAENEQKAPKVCLPCSCLHGGRCRLNSTGSKYECECPKFRSGKHCENVECSVDNRCWRLKDTLYAVIETKLTWPQAKANCESLNMTLAMPKDEERTKFLWTQLKAIYTKSPNNYLWMGLMSEEGMGVGEWEWVDGSALGWYTGGRTDMKELTVSWWGVLFAGGDGGRMWDWGVASNQLYSICETFFHSYNVNIY